MESNGTVIFNARILDQDSNITFNFSVKNTELAKLDAHASFSAHYLPPPKCQNENFTDEECRNNKILDYMNFTFKDYNLESDVGAHFTGIGRIVAADESGKFVITELSEKNSYFKNLFTILKNNPEYFETNIIIYAVLMGAVICSQLWGALRLYLELKFSIEKEITNEKNSAKRTSNERTKKRKQQNMNRFIMNLIFLVFGNFIFVISGFYGGIFLKIVLMLLFIFLVSAEIVQFYYLVIAPARHACGGNGFTKIIGFVNKVSGARYWRDPENYLEMMFLASVPLSILVHDWELAQPESDEKQDFEWKLRSICRGVIALGVFAGWIELIIKKGNVSYSGVGDFIKMFYNIIKTKLFSYLKVCFFLVTAFSLSFWIVMDGHVEDGFSKGFWFSQVLTTTMSIGEFNTGNFYESIKGNGTTKIFAMLLLVILIFLCTITMINLLVAAIISDYNQLKDEVEEENLLFMAEYTIEFERILKNLENYFDSKELDKIENLQEYFFNIITNGIYIRIPENGFRPTYCPHLICTNCALEPLPIPRPGTLRHKPAMEANERNPLLRQILSILEKRDRKEKNMEEQKLEGLSMEQLQIQLEEIERILGRHKKSMK